MALSLYDVQCDPVADRALKELVHHQQRESWKVRALGAGAEFEAAVKPSNNGGCQNVSDLRYAALKRYLAKRFHPDCAPGQGKIFKEIWNEIDRLDQGVSATHFATARPCSAA